jgi:hypothetical protein
MWLRKYWAMKPVLWIHKDPKLFAGYGSITRDYGFGTGSQTGVEPYQKSSKKLAIG